MEHEVEVRADAMTDIPSFLETGSGIQKFIKVTSGGRIILKWIVERQDVVLRSALI
jgi:hypothetical protein